MKTPMTTKKRKKKRKTRRTTTTMKKSPMTTTPTTNPHPTPQLPQNPPTNHPTWPPRKKHSNPSQKTDLPQQLRSHSSQRSPDDPTTRRAWQTAMPATTLLAVRQAVRQVAHRTRRKRLPRRVTRRTGSEGNELEMDEVRRTGVRRDGFQSIWKAFFCIGFVLLLEFL
jgi:hypothetical protein